MSEDLPIQEKEMTSEDVIGFLELCDQHEIEIYVDGGWGVDALLGMQTRRHSDLDIALPHRYVPILQSLLEGKGYRVIETNDQRDCNFVMQDNSGHEIDFHSYTFDENGKNIFGVEYIPEHLTGVGTLNGRKIKTIDAEWMVKFHTGYEVDKDDYHDVKLLCEKFGLEIPAEFRKFEANDKPQLDTIVGDDIPLVAMQTGHSNPETLQNWKERSKRGGLVMFAIREGEHYIASANLLLDGADEQIVKDEIGTVPMINGLGVNEAYRKQGLGSKLMDACEAYVRNHPELSQRIALGVEEHNDVARKMYEERGYKYHKINGEDIYNSSWPEIDADGNKKMYHATCYLMAKDL